MQQNTKSALPDAHPGSNADKRDDVKKGLGRNPEDCNKGCIGGNAPYGGFFEMTARRTPPPGYESQPGLPHDHKREGGQAYAKEVEDYESGVALPPTEQVGPDADRKMKKPLPERK